MIKYRVFSRPDLFEPGRAFPLDLRNALEKTKNVVQIIVSPSQEGAPARDAKFNFFNIPCTASLRPAVAALTPPRSGTHIAVLGPQPEPQWTASHLEDTEGR